MTDESYYPSLFPTPNEGLFYMLGGYNTLPVICCGHVSSFRMLEIANESFDRPVYTSHKQIIRGSFKIDRLGRSAPTPTDYGYPRVFESCRNPVTYKTTGKAKNEDHTMSIDCMSDDQLNTMLDTVELDRYGRIRTWSLTVKTGNNTQYLIIFTTMKQEMPENAARHLIETRFKGSVAISSQQQFMYPTALSDNGRHIPITY